MAQEFEVRQGLFLPIPACPLNVDGYELPSSGPYLSPTHTIKSVSGQGSQEGFISKIFRCYKHLLESALRQRNWEGQGEETHGKEGLTVGSGVHNEL